MTRSLARMLYFLAFIPALLGCRRGPSSDQGVILLSVVGNAPFSDYVSTLNIDGSGYRRLLSPNSTESYMYASGYNSKGPLFVIAHGLVSNDKVEDYAFVYSPPDRKRVAMQTAQGSVGRGALSPDGSRAVFGFAPGRETYYKLYTKRPEDAEPVRLTISHEDNETEGYASWRADGQEVTFLGLRVSSGHLASRLLRVPASGGEPSVILGDDSPGGAAYSPNGRTLYALTNRGIEELEPDGNNRRLILDRKLLPDRGFRYGCISAGPEVIVFAMMNKKKESEIWTVTPNGQNAKKIYTLTDGSIEGVFFLAN
jgi:hypothetical protein